MPARPVRECPGAQRASRNPRWRPGREKAGPLFLALLLLAWTPLVEGAGAADPTIRAQVNFDQVPVGGIIDLTVELEGFSNQAQGPDFGKPEGFEIYDAGSSRNMSWVNGKFSSSITYTYQLVARRAGEYTLGPITVTDKGRTYRANPMTLVITDASGTASRPAAGGGDREEQLPAATAERGLFARVAVDRDTAFLGQQVTLHFRLYQRADVRLYEITGFEPPPSSGFWREDLGAQRDYQVRLDGEIYQVREISWALFPTQTGELEIGPGRIVCHVPARARRRGRFSDFFGGTMFDREAVPLVTEPLRIEVKPLPAENRPAGFSGSVGDYEIRAAFDSPEGRQGEPLALTVTVRGVGHIQAIGAPIWPEWEGLRVFESGDAVSVRKKEGIVSGEKTFTQVLIPTRSGPLTIDPVRFSFFEPAAARYQTIATAPLRLNVLPADTNPGDSGPGDVVALGDDILYIHTDLLPGLRPVAEGGRISWSWLVHLLPLVLVAAAGWLRERRAVLERNPLLARRSQALRTARAGLKQIDAGRSPGEVAARLAEVTEDYLSDWLDVEVRGLRRGDLKGQLREAGLTPQSAEGALAILDWADEVRFGAGAGGDARRRLQEAGKQLADLETAFRGSKLGAGL